ncbi:MAG: hypothetical protein GY906_26320 [bacterium]|nr:hypothetical protein [bacterium]
MGEYARAVSIGLKSFVVAMLGWRDNPYTIAVGRRLWGRLPLLSLAGLTLAGIAAGPFFPSFDKIAGFVPPLAFLTWMPVDVTQMLWSIPAVFGLVVAWRVRCFRGDVEDTWLGLADIEDPGRRIFESAAIPIGFAALFLGFGLELLPRLLELAAGQPVEWGSVGSWSLSLSETILAVAVVAGVLSLNRCFSKAFGQLVGAAFMIFGLRMGLSYALPWMTAWWSYLPIPYVDRFGGGHSLSFGILLFNLAVVAIAWAKLRARAGQSPFWSAESLPDAPESEKESSLPPIPGD